MKVFYKHPLVEATEEKRDWLTMHPRVKEGIISELIFSGRATAVDVEMLLDEGMSPDQKLSIGAPVLQMAAHQGMLDIVGLLLNRGADVNLVFEYGGTGGKPLTALDSATSPDSKKCPQREEIIELLRSHGAKKGAECHTIRETR